jgi:hypothetical protein
MAGHKVRPPGIPAARTGNKGRRDGPVILASAN